MSAYAVEVAKRKLSNARAALENAMDALDEAAEALTAANDETPASARPDGPGDAVGVNDA